MGSGLVTLVATLALLLVGLRLVVGHATPFSPARALTRMRSSGGSNATLVLAVVSLAGSALSDSDLLAARATPSAIATPLAAGCLVAVVGLVVARAPTERLLAMLGAVLGIAKIGAEHGPHAALATVVLIALLVWFLGLVRGFTA